MTLHSITSELTHRRNWFLGGFDLTYDITIPHTQDLLRFVTSFCGMPPVSDWLKEASLLDIKGRDSQNIIPSAPLTTPALENELLSIGGSWAPPTEEDDEDKILDEKTAEEAEEPTLVPFSIAVVTPFLSFEGSNHIRHAIHIHRSPKLPLTLLPSQVDSLAEVTIDYFRLGIDLYSSRSIVAMLGTSSEVNETLLIETSTKSCAVRILSERLPSKSTPPLQRNNLLQTVAEHVKEWSSYDILDDLRQKGIQIDR